MPILRSPDNPHLLYELRQDLAPFTPYPPNNSEIKVRDIYDSVQYGGPESAILDAHRLTQKIIAEFQAPLQKPVHPLARRTVEIAQNRQHLPVSPRKLGDLCCLEAEPRLLHSLASHDRRRMPKDIRPAAILFDTQGEPFAYRKASGIRTAYAWRTAIMSSQQGRYLVPEDCFFVLDYGTENSPTDPINNAIGHTLIAPRDAELPYTIGFLRFSNTSLEPSLRKVGIDVARKHKDALRKKYPEAARFTPRDIGQRVMHLFESSLT